jgi:acyl-CoA synthetase (AMP-forming)/AMP-acid ligase II
LLAARATETGDAPAVIDRETHTSYTRVAGRAGAFAGALRDARVAAGDRVAVLLERGADALAAVFGVHAIGAVAVVVNERLRAAQVEHILRDADATVLITSANQLAQLGRPLAVRVASLDIGDVPPHAPFAPVPREPGDLAHIIYTSGSTGLPRGVMHTHGTIAAGVSISAAYLGLRESDRIASIVSFSAVFGLNQLLSGVSVGAAAVVERGGFPADIVGTFRREQVTVAASVPPLWLQLLNVPDFSVPIPSLRQIQCAGGHLPIDAVRRIRTAQPHADLILQYGMTETWRSTFLPPREVASHPGSMGTPVPHADILVVREDGALCADGETGELVHAGPTIASGYWRDAEQTARVFRPHPLRASERAVFSGDYVRRDGTGLLTYVGRRDRLIKTLGHRIGPDEIEEALHASGQVSEAAVAAEPDPERGQRIVAWVVLRPDGSRERIIRHCRSTLPSYMQPARIEIADRLPRLASGKYDLAALRGTLPR